MSLKPCRECGREISTDALACPECGAPFPARVKWTGAGLEWKSRTTVLGFPLVHVAFGRDGQGKLRVAKGIIAVGQFAVGLITLAQFGIGILFGFGQFLIGLTVVAQFAGGLLLGIGQFATGIIVVGQVAVGVYAICQLGLATYMWGPSRTDMEAVAMFSTILLRLRELLGL
jgi:hypothetical protein